MSGCNCKNGEQAMKIADNRPVGTKIIHYTLKTVVFGLMLILLPIINLFLIYFMFQTLVLNREVDVKPLLIAIGKKFKPKEQDDESYYDNLSEDDVEMVGVEVIKK